MLRGFEKTFPQVKVDYAPVSGDYPASMLARFSARTAPDVFYRPPSGLRSTGTPV